MPLGWHHRGLRASQKKLRLSKQRFETWQAFCRRRQTKSKNLNASCKTPGRPK
jgi:hypothetical protein